MTESPGGAVPAVGLRPAAGAFAARRLRLDE